MTNDNDSNNPPTDSQSEPPPQPPVVPPAPAERKIRDDPKKSTDTDQKTAKELAREFRWVEGAQLAISAVLAVVGIAALVIYHGQLTVMRGQLGEVIRQFPEIQKSAKAATDAADINREALYSVQRAYIAFPPSPQITIYPFQSGRVFMFTMPIENAGNTQAHMLKDRVSCEITMGPLPNDFIFPDKKGECGTPWVATGANVIPAKGTMLSQSVSIDDKVMQEFIQQNLGPWPGRLGAPDHPTRGIVFYGWVTYRDIFKDSPEHLSEFCRDLQTVVLTGNPQAQWGYCATHNCTDEECPDYNERIRVADTAPKCCPKKWFKNRK